MNTNTNQYTNFQTIYEDPSVTFFSATSLTDNKRYFIKAYQLPEDIPQYFMNQIWDKISKSKTIDSFNSIEYRECQYIQSQKLFQLIYCDRSSWTNIHEIINSKEEKDHINFTPQQAFYLIISYIEGIIHVLTKTSIHCNISLNNVIYADDRVLIDYQSALLEYLIDHYKGEETYELKLKPRQETLLQFMNEFGCNLLEIINYFKFYTKFGNYFEHSKIQQITNYFLKPKRNDNFKDHVKLLKEAQNIFKQYYTKLKLNPKGNSIRLLCYLNSMIGDAELFQSQQEHYSKYLNNFQTNHSTLEWHAIHICADQNNIELLKYLLNNIKDLDPNLTNVQNQSPLLISVQNGQLEMTKYLIEEVGANPNQLDFRNNSVLNLSTINGHINIIRYLLEQIQVPSYSQLKKENQSEVNDVIAYSTMVRENSDNFILDLNHQNINGQTPLMQSVQYGYANLFYYLIDKSTINLDLIDSFNNNLLHLSAMNNLPEIVKYLIKKEEYPIKKINKATQNALEVSAFYGSFEVFQELFNGPFFNSKNSIQKSFVLSTSQGRKKITDFIIEKYIKNPKFEYLKDCNPINKCASTGNLFMLKYYLEQKFPKKEQYLNTLQGAIKAGHYHVIVFLCKNVIILDYWSFFKAQELLIKYPSLRTLKFLCQTAPADDYSIAQRLLYSLRETLNYQITHPFISYCCQRLSKIKILKNDHYEAKDCVRIAIEKQNFTVVRQVIEATHIDYPDYHQVLQVDNRTTSEVKHFQLKFKDYLESIYN